MKILNAILITLILWFQFGAEAFQTYQLDACIEKHNGNVNGMAFSALFYLPGGYPFLNIMIGECDEN